MQNQTKTKSKWKVWHMIVISIVILIVIGIGSMVRTADAVAENKRLTNPKERRADLIKKAFNDWDGSHVKLVEYVKKGMNDPNSFEHVKTTFLDKGNSDTIIVNMTYRGKNAFNATVTETVMATAKTNGDLLSVNK